MLLVYTYRKTIAVSDVKPGEFNKSYLASNVWLYVLAFLSLGILAIIVINLLTKSSKTCVAEKSELKMLLSNTSLLGGALEEIYGIFEKS